MDWSSASGAHRFGRQDKSVVRAVCTFTATPRARSSARSMGNNSRPRCHAAAMVLSATVALVLAPLLKVPARFPTPIEVHPPTATVAAATALITTAARNAGVGSSPAAAAIDLTRNVSAGSRAEGGGWGGGNKLVRSAAGAGGGRRRMKHEAGAGEESVLTIRWEVGELGRSDGEIGSNGDYPGDMDSVEEELEPAGLEGDDAGAGIRGEGSAGRLRDEHAGVVVDADEVMHVDGGERERHLPKLGTLAGGKSLKERQLGEEEGKGSANRGLRDKYELEDDPGGFALSGSNNARIDYAGEGGTLMDGRNRCFLDNEDHHRCYPTVFFFGTSKCGTTSLARWLDAHPRIRWVANPRRPNQVEETGVKEAHVFDDSPKTTRGEMKEIHHEKLFMTAPKANAGDVVIDYTPHYLAVSEAPHRIADLYGLHSGLKFVITLREPASRAISSWEFKNEFNVKKGRIEERRSLSKTISDGKKRAAKLGACVSLAKTKRVGQRERDLNMCNPRRFLEMPLFVAHVGKSLYALQLERWFDLFGRENFKVVFTDDMAVNPVGVLEEVLEFLGLDLTGEDKSKGLPDRQTWNKITGMAYNKTKSKKKEELEGQVTDELLYELRKFYEPYNRQLEAMIGYPVPDSWN